MERLKPSLIRVALVCILLVVVPISSSCAAIASLQKTNPTVSPTPTHADPTGFLPIALPNGRGYQSEEISVYFTTPDSLHANSEVDGVDQILIQSIKEAKVAIDLAIYSFDLYSLQKAIQDAHNRGVSIRIVTDADMKDAYSIIRLRDSGIPIVFDTEPSLMHNKFMIVDGIQVWTGSTNFTTEAFYQDNNNVIQINNKDLAQIYQQEFDEMFLDGIFGMGKRLAAQPPITKVNGKTVETFFAPDDEPARRIVKLLSEAKTSIVFYTYALTGEDYGDALLAASKRGVKIEGILDDSLASNKGSELEKLQNAGIFVATDQSQGLLHHKVFIIDNSIVITGSYNFSANAEKRNDENVIIFHDTAIAALFADEYQQLMLKIGNTP